MEIDVKWVEGMQFKAETPSGHTLTMDGSVEGGGKNLGPRPTELLLTAVGGCTGMDIVSILQKMQQSVEGVEVQITGQRAEEHPRRFTNLRLHFVVTGKGLGEDRVQRAVQLSAEKYCSVSHSLNADIQWDFEIVES